MDTRKIKVIAVLTIAALTLSSPVIYAASYDKGAQEEEGQAGKKMEAGRQKLYKDLNLTEEQKKLLDENKNKRKEEMKALFNQRKEKKAAIREELQKEELNTGKITQLNNDLKVLDAQMLDHKLEGILEVRKILTPEQFKKFITKMEKRQEHFKGKRD